MSKGKEGDSSQSSESRHINEKLKRLKVKDQKDWTVAQWHKVFFFPSRKLMLGFITK